MLLKSKICFTVVAIYEMVAVSILHFQRICDAIFPTPFCDSWYRYFLFCVIVPLIGGLIWMWIREIIRAHRRRRFIRRAKNTVNGVISSLRGRVGEHIDPRDMEKIITAAILIGIKRYADRHPNLRRNVNDIMGFARGEVDIDIMSSADETAPASRRAPRRAPARPKSSSRPKK